MILCTHSCLTPALSDSSLPDPHYLSLHRFHGYDEEHHARLPSGLSTCCHSCSWLNLTYSARNREALSVFGRGKCAFIMRPRAFRPAQTRPLRHLRESRTSSLILVLLKHNERVLPKINASPRMLLRPAVSLEAIFLVTGRHGGLPRQDHCM